MAEQDYSRWAAFGGGPPAKKQVEDPPAAAGFNPTFQGGPSQQMNNSMDFAPVQGMQQEKSFAPAMGKSMLQQASNRFGGMMHSRQGFAESAPQYDEAPPMEPQPRQGFWNDLGGRQPQTRMAGYQQDRGIGKNWGQSAPQQAPQAQYQERQPQEMQGYRGQASRQQPQGFRRPPPRRPAPQYRRSAQNSGGQW